MSPFHSLTTSSNHRDPRVERTSEEGAYSKASCPDMKLKRPTHKCPGCRQKSSRYNHFSHSIKTKEYQTVMGSTRKFSLSTHPGLGTLGLLLPTLWCSVSIPPLSLSCLRPWDMVELVARPPTPPHPQMQENSEGFEPPPVTVCCKDCVAYLTEPHWLKLVRAQSSNRT